MPPRDYALRETLPLFAIMPYTPMRRREQALHAGLAILIFFFYYMERHYTRVIAVDVLPREFRSCPMPADIASRVADAGSALRIHTT